MIATSHPDRNGKPRFAMPEFSERMTWSDWLATAYLRLGKRTARVDFKRVDLRGRR